MLTTKVCSTTAARTEKIMAERKKMKQAAVAAIGTDACAIHNCRFVWFNFALIGIVLRYQYIYADLEQVSALNVANWLPVLWACGCHFYGHVTDFFFLNGKWLP